MVTQCKWQSQVGGQALDPEVLTTEVCFRTMLLGQAVQSLTGKASGVLCSATALLSSVMKVAVVIIACGTIAQIFFFKE